MHREDGRSRNSKDVSHYLKPLFPSNRLLILSSHGDATWNLRESHGARKLKDIVEGLPRGRGPGKRYSLVVGTLRVRVDWK